MKLLQVSSFHSIVLLETAQCFANREPKIMQEPRTVYQVNDMLTTGSVFGGLSPHGMEEDYH